MNFVSYISSLALMAFCWCTSAERFPEITLYEGDACVTSSYDGTCLIEKQCSNLEHIISHKGLYARDVGRCGYTVYEEIICCPTNIAERPLSKKYFESYEVSTNVTLIITTTSIVQCEKIGEDLVFSNFTRAEHVH
ncbi:uncharacterized protein [Eurosta solidaginis]|uniref:uncharacterized protein isoform X2 n=1 Tax=Eurosta solidaginis TaxID=178769 RepID=UPI003530ADD2